MKDGWMGFVTLQLGCLLALIFVPLIYIWNGFVLQQLWGWFAVEKFALPPLSIAEAIGISLIVGFLTTHVSDAKEKQEAWITLVAGVINTGIVLLIGFVVHLFM